MNNGFILSKLYKKRIAEKRLQKLYIYQKTKHFDFISALQRFVVRLPVYLRDNGGTDTCIFDNAAYENTYARTATGELCFDFQGIGMP